MSRRRLELLYPPHDIWSARQHVLVAHLRRTRESLGITQDEAGRIFGYGQPWMSKLESGQRRVLFHEVENLGFLYACEWTSLPTFPDSGGLQSD